MKLTVNTGIYYFTLKSNQLITSVMLQNFGKGCNATTEMEVAAFQYDLALKSLVSIQNVSRLLQVKANIEFCVKLKPLFN